MVAALGASFCDGVKRSTAGQSVMKLCASQWKDAKAAGTTGGQSWPQFLAQCRTRQGSAAAPSGGLRGSGAGPSPSARLSVGLSVPMVAAVGSIFLIRRDRDSASRRIDHRTRGACAVPSDTIVWANTPSRIYQYSGTRYSGTTRNGAYMCEADARATGYRASRGRSVRPGRLSVTTPSGLTAASAGLSSVSVM